MTKPAPIIAILILANAALTSEAGSPGLSKMLDPDLAAAVPVVLRVCHTGDRMFCDGSCSYEARLLEVLKNDESLPVAEKIYLEFWGRDSLDRSKPSPYPPYGELTVYVSPGPARQSGERWSLEQDLSLGIVGYSHAECPWNPKPPVDENCWLRCREKLNLPYPDWADDYQ